MDEFNKLDWILSSSFFYSDDGYAAGGFIHQIFSGRPQGILWDQTILNDPQKIVELLSRGTNTFILVTINSPEFHSFDEMIASGVAPLEKITFAETGYILYHLRK